jgi:phage tail-like protein
MEILPSFLFSVTFLAKGVIPNAVDIRFSKVSGLSAEVATSTVTEGGQNLYQHRLPDHISYGNLVLERGRVLLSPLDMQTTMAFTLFDFRPALSHVLIMLHGEEGGPRAAWMAFDAYPVTWSSSDLDASATEVLIDTLELAYTRLQRIGL